MKYSKKQSPRMFSRIAKRYDSINKWMSLGLHKGWKKRLVSEMKEGEGLHVLDLATGTGDIAELVSKRSNVTSVIGVDPSKGMLEVARSRNVSKNVRYEIGDAQHLDYDDQSFDRILMSFGIRNVPNTEKALKEIKRILKPRGEALGIFTAEQFYCPFFLFECLFTIHRISLWFAFCA